MNERMNTISFPIPSLDRCCGVGEIFQFLLVDGFMSPGELRYPTSNTLEHESHVQALRPVMYSPFPERHVVEGAFCMFR
jgi:hypothetical protein